MARTRSTSLVVAMMVVALWLSAAPTASANSAATQLTWRDRRVDLGVAQGGTLHSEILFDAGGAGLSDAAVQVTGPVAGYVDIDVDRMVPTGDGGYALPVTASLPADASGVPLPGALRLRDGRKPIGASLPLRITPQLPDSSTMPRGGQEPSPDRVGTSPGGSTVAVDEYIVTFDFDEPDPDALARRIAADTGAVIIGSEPRGAMYQLRWPGSTLAQTLARRPALESYEEVEHVSLNAVGGITAIPDDTEWDRPWDVSVPGGNNWGLEWIDAPGAWAVTTGGTDVRIGVIDGDFDGDHGDLVNNASGERGREEGGHGTHVAGTVCAQGNNDKGITGMLWRCKLRHYSHDWNTFTTAVRMMDAADAGNRVVNMSLQFAANNEAVAITTEFRREVEDLNDIFSKGVLYAQRANIDVLWVFAAGNEQRRDVRFTAPAGLVARFPTNTMAVAAIDRAGGLSGFSNRGELISVAAPGVDILSTMPRSRCWLFGRCVDNYDFKEGTSMAAPHVAGLAGLVAAADPSRTAADLKRCIVAGANSADTIVPGNHFSTINAPAAVRCAGVIDLPSKVDVVLAFDLTGSMGGVIGQAKSQMTQAIADIAEAAPTSDIRWAVTSYEDHPGSYDSRPCGSTYSATYGASTDRPYRLNTGLGSADEAIDAIAPLRLGSGADGPESYGYALWRIAQDRDGEIGFREDALKLIINFGDNVPHDRDINHNIGDPPLSNGDTGIDPGDNGTIDCVPATDLDWHDDTLQALFDEKIRLLHVDSSSGWTGPYWRDWTSRTGGAYTLLGSDRSLTEVFIELLTLL